MTYITTKTTCPSKISSSKATALRALLSSMLGSHLRRLLGPPVANLFTLMVGRSTLYRLLRLQTDHVQELIVVAVCVTFSNLDAAATIQSYLGASRATMLTSPPLSIITVRQTCSSPIRRCTGMTTCEFRGPVRLTATQAL